MVPDLKASLATGVKAAGQRLLRAVLRNQWLAARLARATPAPIADHEFLRRNWQGLLRRRAADSLDLRLLAAMIQWRAQSKSQLGQDLFALAVKTDPQTPGFFVEFGATDGIALSNSYLLETQFGWSGLLSEPNPVWHEPLKANRRAAVSFDCIGPRSGETVEFLQTDQPELATIAAYAAGDRHAAIRSHHRGSIRLPTVSLLDFLRAGRAPRQIDYLSIDTEGSEYEILREFDFNAFRFRAITVEHNFSDSREPVYQLLVGNGYRRVLRDLSAWDDWYVDAMAPDAA